MEEKILKTYEIILFCVLLIVIGFQMLSFFFPVFNILDTFLFILLIAMFIAWAILLRNKDLTNFEIVLFILLFIFAIGNMLLLIGFAIVTASWLVFGIHGEMLFLIFLILAMMFWFFRIYRAQKKLGVSKYTLQKSDIIIIICAITLILILAVFYLVQ